MTYSVTCLEGYGFREPTPNNLKLNNSGIHFGVPFLSKTKLTILWENVLKIDQTANFVDKRVSYGKALAGGLIFGPVGAIIGGVSGSRSLERTLTVVFLAEDNSLQSISIESKASLPIRDKIEKEMKKRFGTTDRTEQTDKLPQE